MTLTINPPLRRAEKNALVALVAALVAIAFVLGIWAEAKASAYQQTWNTRRSSK